MKISKDIYQLKSHLTEEETNIKGTKIRITTAKEVQLRKIFLQEALI